MIDIHSHILSMVDDGSQSARQSIEMAKSAEEQGIRMMIATPHHKNGRYENTKTTIIEEVRRFNEVLKEQQIDLTILPGQEVRLYGEILDDYQKNEILTLNQSNYVLVEFPSDHVPSYASRLFYEMKLTGIQPVIAHPERNRAILERPDKLFDLVEQGVLAQVTASSMTGRFGKKIKNFAHQLVDHHLVHFIASDAHNASTRPNELQQAFQTIEEAFDLNLVYYFQENAEILVNDQTVFVEPPARIRMKKFLGIF
ncbi:manganese-dependent protein-tyrosine phosphatase [Halalkalibacter wakoensis JCM 9140]|uniref:Tyrosine-protein phosphatase n=1 Tax=Halalkalibacter wakoensis JCM 9140 TaxID=1236970 RepID=W4Q8Y2_9BACI|nr:CpsB/CapC family capsule biosynthesis tyrosine phosphatase [Halalkalibacter wakoensis]GAE28412.1 manganese-dependent protein-tyrosine phosphatase [Halalkalibacter wakoensis JCM 9140]